jgi:hypothetical protein
MKKIARIVLAASFIGFVACEQKETTVEETTTEEVTVDEPEVVVEDTATVVETDTTVAP